MKSVHTDANSGNGPKSLARLRTQETSCSDAVWLKAMHSGIGEEMLLTLVAAAPDGVTCELHSVSHHI